jgi:hypothetical protein
MFYLTHYFVCLRAYTRIKLREKKLAHLSVRLLESSIFLARNSDWCWDSVLSSIQLQIKKSESLLEKAGVSNIKIVSTVSECDHFEVLLKKCFVSVQEAEVC